MFKIMHVISALVRQFLLPNPYASWFEMEIYADLFNIVIGGFILHMLTYSLTGVAYTKGIDSPTAGSAGYLISYCYLTLIIILVGKLIVNVKMAIIIFVVIYVISLLIVSKLFSRRYSF